MATPLIPNIHSSKSADLPPALVRKCVDCDEPALPPGKRGPVPIRCAKCKRKYRLKPLLDLGQRKCKREGCGVRFRPHMRKHRFCSARCNRRARDEHHQKHGIDRIHTCKGCGKGFRPKRARYKHYCSRACSFNALKTGVRQAYRQERVRWPNSTVFCGQCTRCARAFVSRVKRSLCAKCRGPRPRVERQCKDCGEAIRGTAGLKRCKSCSAKRSRALYAAKHGRVKKHRERALRFGVAYEAINPIDVFERDGWRCQICGKATPKRLRGSLKDNAPELDHRTPMARGGSHTWDNVQCACRACNIDKGSKTTKGQLTLFPVAPAGGPPKVNGRHPEIDRKSVV